MHWQVCRLGAAERRMRSDRRGARSDSNDRRRKKGSGEGRRATRGSGSSVRGHQARCDQSEAKCDGPSLRQTRLHPLKRCTLTFHGVYLVLNAPIEQLCERCE